MKIPKRDARESERRKWSRMRVLLLTCDSGESMERTGGAKDEGGGSSEVSWIKDFVLRGLGIE